MSSPSVYEQLSAAVSHFRDSYSRFKTLQVPSSMRAEYESIASKARAAQNTIDTVLGGVETVKGWFGLGFLPLVPIAIGAGAAAAALGIIVAVYKLIDNFIQRAEATKLMSNNPGMSYQTALNQVQIPERAGTLDKVTTLGWLALGLGALYLFTRK